MTTTIKHSEAPSVPFVRVFRGNQSQEPCSNGRLSAAVFEITKAREQRLADLFWAGRSHAMRRSARIAA